MDDIQTLGVGIVFVVAYVAAIVWGVRRAKRRRGVGDGGSLRHEDATESVAPRGARSEMLAIPPEPAPLVEEPSHPSRGDGRARHRTPAGTARASGRMTTAQWLAGRRHRTERGEMVRSEVEVVIANHLHRRGFRYVYEAEVCGFRPDFFLPEHGIVIEFWGGRDEEYIKRRRRKTRAYLSAGYGLVSLSPGKGLPVERDLDRQLYHRLKRK